MSGKNQLKMWSLTLVALAVMGTGLYYYKSAEIQQKSSQVMPEYPEPIDAVKASLVQYKEQVRVPAEVVAPDSVMLTTQLAGKITKLDMQNGAQVKKGQLLLQLDISEEAASLKNAKARAELSQAELKRTRSLFKKQLASQDALDKANAEVKINQAEVDRIVAIINKKTIYAPFDGVLGLHELSVGEYLQANSEVSSLVANAGHLWIDINLSQTQTRLLSDQKLELFQSNSQQPIWATIIAKEPIVTAQARSLKHRAKLELSSNVQLTPGEFVQVLVKQGTAEPMFKLPKQAVLRQQASRYVYVLKQDKPGTYRTVRRDIKLFQEDANYSYIESGLKEGEQVVTTGAFKLYPNKLVSIRQAKVDNVAKAAKE
ncbi:MAG: efflux RND transporter periplasmic adaptor subunit [Parashewanella sp.]